MSTRTPRNSPPEAGRPASASGPPSTPDRYYFANGQKIPLCRSHRFLAVRAKGHSGEDVAEAAFAALSQAAPSHPPHVMAIPGHDLAVVALEETGPSTNIAAAPPGPAALSAMMQGPDAELAPGPTVYEAFDEDGGDAPILIPVGEVIVQFRATATAEQRQQLLKRHDAVEDHKDPMVPDRVVIRVKTEEGAIDVANALQKDDLVAFAEPNFVTLVRQTIQPDDRTDAGFGSGAAAVAEAEPKSPSSMQLTVDDAADLLTELAPAQEVEAPPIPAAAPSDPAFPSQWALEKIRAPEAWAIHQGNPSIRVAVLDDGCDIAHEDISFQLPGYDAFANDNDPTPVGNDAHGTACAGIVAMKRHNGRGGVGVAPGCRVLPVRIAQGAAGNRWLTSTEIITRGILWAAARADVLSNSWGGGAPSTAITEAFRTAATTGRGGKGCALAAASGNVDVRGVSFPARLSADINSMMAVGASNRWDERKSLTSRDGERWGSTYGPELNVLAPGVQVFTTDVMGAPGYTSGHYFPSFNGTSAATPHVAGLMALILSVDPNLRGWEVRQIIEMTARDLGAAGRDELTGFGRIDCRKALEAASKVWAQVSVTPIFIGTGEECFMRMNLRVYNSGINTVRLSSVTVRSLTPGGAEIDRFEYRPDPGGTMLPRAGHGASFPRILLRASGTRASYSYRYAVTWSYTFWRPTGPGLPLGAATEPIGSGEESSIQGITGGDSGGAEPAGTRAPGRDRGRMRPALANGQSRPDGFPVAPAGDSITIDRETRAITIVIR